MASHKSLKKLNSYLESYENPFLDVFLATSEQLLMLILKAREISINKKNSNCLDDLFKLYTQLGERKVIYTASMSDLSNYKVGSFNAIRRSRKERSNALKSLSKMLIELDQEVPYIDILTGLSNMEQAQGQRRASAYVPDSNIMKNADVPHYLSVLKELLAQREEHAIFPIKNSVRLGFSHWDLAQAKNKPEKLIENLNSFHNIDGQNIVRTSVDTVLGFLNSEDEKHSYQDLIRVLANEEDEPFLQRIKDELDSWKDQLKIVPMLVDEIEKCFAEKTLFWLDGFYNEFMPVHSRNRGANWNMDENENGDEYIFKIDKNDFEFHLASGNIEYLLNRFVECVSGRKIGEIDLLGGHQPEKADEAKQEIVIALKGMTENYRANKDSITRMDTLQSYFQGIKCYDIYHSRKITVVEAASLVSLDSDTLSKESIKREYKKIKRIVNNDEKASFNITDKLAGMKPYEYEPWVSLPLWYIV